MTALAAKLEDDTATNDAAVKHDAALHALSHVEMASIAASLSVQDRHTVLPGQNEDSMKFH
jgi:hypothetical protein